MVLRKRYDILGSLRRMKLTEIMLPSVRRHLVQWALYDSFGFINRKKFYLRIPYINSYHKSVIEQQLMYQCMKLSQNSIII